MSSVLSMKGIFKSIAWNSVLFCKTIIYKYYMACQLFCFKLRVYLWVYILFLHTCCLERKGPL
jgi:hypothetical protein